MRAYNWTKYCFTHSSKIIEANVFHETVLFHVSTFLCHMEASAIGGAKKRNLAQMEKSQSQQDQEEASSKKQKAKSGPPEKKIRAVELQRVDERKLVGEISKMGAITPYAVSSHFNIRIGAARDILEELEKKKILASVGGNARIRIYRAVAA